MTDQKLDRIRKLVALLALLILVIAVVALSFSDRTNKPMAINGDVLGQDSSESLEQYVDRAAASVAQTPADDNAFALVTFSPALDPADAAGAVDDIERVNAMVMLSAAPMGLPEPVAGETRADVFDRQVDRLRRSLDGIGNVQAPEVINGVIVWDDGEALRALAQVPGVLAVEALPVDAGWGHFGVRPVYTDDTGNRPGAELNTQGWELSQDDSAEPFG